MKKRIWILCFVMACVLTLPGTGLADYEYMPRGLVETADGNSVSGWAYDPAAPEDSIDVRVYVNGTFIGSATADMERTDLGAASGPHGFLFQSSEIARGVNSVKVFAEGVGANGPIVLLRDKNHVRFDDNNGILYLPVVRVESNTPFGIRPYYYEAILEESNKGFALRHLEMISPGNIQSSAFYDETEALLTIPVGEVVVYHPVELASRFYEAGMIHQNDKFFLQYQVEVFPYEGAPEVYELNAPDEVVEKETFSISFNYDDPQGTFEVSRCRVIMSSGFQLHFDLDGSGLFQSELLMFPEEGDNWIELYVKDKQGNESNRLRKNIRVKKWEPPGVFTLTGVLNHPACVEVCGSCCTDTELEAVDGASYFIKESDIVLDDYVDGEEHAFRVYLTLETGSCDAGKCIYANILRVEEEM